jgi:hypothetical protein
MFRRCLISASPDHLAEPGLETAFFIQLDLGGGGVAFADCDG